MDKTYITKGPITTFVRLKENLANKSRYDTCNWAKEQLYGWVIGYEPTMQCLGVEILKWDDTNKRLNSTTCSGVVGSKADLRKKLKYCARQGSGQNYRDEENSEETEQLLDDILADMKPFQDQLEQSPVYGIIQKTVDAFQTGEQVDPDNLPDSFALAYWKDEEPDKDWQCGCGELHGKGISGTINVYDIAKVLRSEISLNELRQIYSNFGLNVLNEGGRWIVKEGESRGTYITPGSLKLLIPNHSLSLSNYERATVLHEHIGFYDATMNHTFDLKDFQRFGLNKNSRIIPKELAQEYLGNMKILNDFWMYISDVSQKVLKEASDSWEARKKLSNELKRRENQAKLSLIKGPLLDILCRSNFDERTIKPGMNVGFAYAYPAQGINLKIGKVSNVREVSGEPVFDIETETYSLELTLDLKVRYGSLGTNFKGAGEIIFRNPSFGTKFAYENGKSAFASNGQALAQFVQGGPEGQFTLPKFISCSADELEFIKGAVHSTKQ